MTEVTTSRAGRRKAFTDEQVFEAISSLLREGGISTVSLPAIAKRIGFTHQALTYRFETRDGLLAAYAAWLWGRTHAAQERILQEPLGPLAMVRRLFLSGAHGAGPGDRIEDSMSEMVGFLFIELQRDPATHATFAVNQPIGEARVIQVITRGQEAGVLDPRVPATEILDALVYASIGASVFNNGIQRTDGAVDRVTRAFEAALARYTIESGCEA